MDQGEFWIFFFILAWALLNWPILTMTVGKILFGVPIVLMYLGAVWVLVIMLLYRFDRWHIDMGPSSRGNDDRRHND